jgi:deoxyribonuclease-1
MSRTIGLLLLLVILPGAAAAQKKCSKGIPCGNTCISASKVCGIGTVNSPAPEPTYIAPAPSAPGEPKQWLGHVNGKV